MWGRTTLAMLFVAMALAGASAHACIMSRPIELNDAVYADVVVVGRIENYKIVPGPLSDYSSFNVLVDEVLIGNVPQTLTVTWDNSTFSQPETMPSGPFLIALRDPRSKMPPLRGSGTIFPSPELDLLTVLQAPCSGAFIFASDSDESDAIRRILHAMVEDGAVEDGAFEVYVKEQTLSRTRNAETWSAIPDEVRVRFSSCFAAAVVEGFTPDEISQLDMIDLSDPDPDLAVTKKVADRGRRLVEAIGSSDLSVFGSVCPNDIADFKNYGFCVRRECW